MKKVHIDYEKEMCENAIERAYEKGLEQAWECAREICNINTHEQATIFDEIIISNILKTFTASEAIEKLKEYEEQKQNNIKINDEINKMTDEQKAIQVLSEYTVNFCHYNELEILNAIFLAIRALEKQDKVATTECQRLDDLKQE